MLFLMLLKNWLKPWPDIHDKTIKFDNVQVKSSFDISIIRNPFPVYTLPVLFVSSLFGLETQSRSGWNQQEAEDGMFECTSEENQTSSPRGLSQVQPGGQQGQLLWGELCLMPQEMSSSNLAKQPRSCERAEARDNHSILLATPTELGGWMLQEPCLSKNLLPWPVLV